MSHDRLERRVDAIVHVRRSELDVSQRGAAKEELRRRRLWSVEGILAPSVEWRHAAGSRAELWNAGVRELLSAEQRAIVARRAACLPEEEERPALRVDGQCIVVAREITIECGVRLGEGLRFERGDGVGGVLKTKLAGGYSRERSVELLQ